MPTEPSVDDYLARLLVSRITVTESQIDLHVRGRVSPLHVVSAPKLLLVTKGTLQYELDGKRYDLARGTMLLRPPLTSAQWTASKKSPCSIAWVEFLSEGTDLSFTRPLMSTNLDLELEMAAIYRIHHLFVRNPLHPGLELEAEVKGVLGRFLCHVHPMEGKPVERDLTLHRAVVQAIGLLGRMIAREGDVSEIHRTVGLSPEHFRKLFSQQTGMSAREYLTTLKMRAARFYLMRLDQSVKEVARLVGYNDALYFSRHYRKFWGHPPKGDRGEARRSFKPPPSPWT